MTRIRITKANEDHSVRVDNCSMKADVPIDGQFHELHDDLISVLENSSVEFEVEDAPEAEELELTEQPAEPEHVEQTEEPEQTEEVDQPVNETENADASGGTAAAAGADGLGGSSAPASDEAEQA
jgi:hypothetical protein